jgi:RND superfamily putative drug exporter
MPQQQATAVDVRANRIAGFIAGRRSKYLVLAIAVTVALVFAWLSFGGETEDFPPTLPSSAESRQLDEIVADLPSDPVVPAVIVFAREDGFEPDDIAWVEATAATLVEEFGADGGGPPPGVLTDGAAGAPPSLLQLSDDGRAALAFVPLAVDGEEAPDAIVPDLRDAIKDVPNGLQVKVTGGPAIQADIAAAFEGANVNLLIGTALLVFVLLVVIYRSPVFWIIPLFTVILAEAATRGAERLYEAAGITIDPSVSGITSVLVFGAGTDYALLLVARYREELRLQHDPHAAMRTALATAGPAILASGLTVAACLLVLLLADSPTNIALGALASAGVIFAMLAMLTILPTALLVVGRRVFWPFIPHVNLTAPTAGTTGWWRRLGERVQRRPRATWVAVAVLLAVAASGLTQLDADLSDSGQFRTEVEALEGQELLARSFPGGTSSTTDVWVPGADQARADEIVAELSSADELIATATVEQVSDDGALVALALTLDPYDSETVARIPEVRDLVRGAAGEDALVGGPTAESYDERQVSLRDTRVVVPVALVLSFLILVLLLRALVAPLVLIASVVLSYGAALGIGALAFENVFGFEGSDPGLPLLAFVFLTALGIDYNIFLMTRVREETERHGTSEGMLRGLAVTGSVITSAGVVLAGTFAILASLPIVVLGQLGFVIAVGVFLDTLIVRSVLVPGAVFDLGWRTWAPSKLARQEHDRDRAGDGDRAPADAVEG